MHNKEINYLFYDSFNQQKTVTTVHHDFITYPNIYHDEGIYLKIDIFIIFVWFGSMAQRPSLPNYSKRSLFSNHVTNVRNNASDRTESF